MALKEFKFQIPEEFEELVKVNTTNFVIDKIRETARDNAFSSIEESVKSEIVAFKEANDIEEREPSET